MSPAKNKASSAATVDLTLVAALAGTATAATLLLYRRHRQWHSESEKDKRKAYEEAAQSLVGPNPQMVYLSHSHNTGSTGNKEGTTTSPADAAVGFLTSFASGKENPKQQTSNANNITLVLIHGFGCTSLEFNSFVYVLGKKHPEINVFSYDRILFVPDQSAQTLLQTTTRNARTLAAELHDLLQQRCGKHHKYVLMGHSYGGLIAQHYAQAHPEKMVGMVLIDPAHELQNQKLPRDFSLAMTHVVPWMMGTLYHNLAWTGFLQVLDYFGAFNFPPIFLWQHRKSPRRKACAHLYSHGTYVWKLAAAELQGCMETFEEINTLADATTAATTNDADNDDRRDGNGSGDDVFQRTAFYELLRQHNIPTGLVIAGHRQYTPTLFKHAMTLAFQDMHKDFPCSQVLMASKSDHWVHMQEPQVVLQAVEYVLTYNKATI